VTDRRPTSNWAGNQAYRSTRLLTPRTVDEVQAMVAASRRIRVLGSGHSFNALADTTGDHLSLAGLPPTVEIDRAAATVTVSGGLRYGDVAGRLERAGLALANLASLPHISIAGACATGTHGSGETLGGLGTSVAGLHIVRADGSLEVVDGRTDPDVLDANVVALGLLGVVTAVRLRLEPSFRIRQQVFDDVGFDAVLRAFDDVAGAAYSVSLFTDWRQQTFQVWLKHRVGDDGGPPLPRSLLGVRPASGPRHPVPGIDPTNCTVQRGVAGPWHLRLPHFRMGFTPSAGEELQSEYFVGREQAVAALRALEPLRARIAPLLLISEVRFVAADRLWLSPAYDRSSTAIHFTWKPDWPAVRDLLPQIEAALAPFEPRPHWGKLFTIDGRVLRTRFTRLAAFAELAAAADPSGKFRNGFTDALVFGRS